VGRVRITQLKSLEERERNYYTMRGSSGIQLQPEAQIETPEKFHDKFQDEPADTQHLPPDSSTSI
jgi:hypothetical protein